MNATHFEDNEHGSYYTWFTATAGSTISSGDAPNSICPKGWKLPNNNNYIEIVSDYGKDLISGVPKFNLYGRIYQAELKDRDSNKCGHYWSSTSTSANNSDALNLDSGNPQASESKSRADYALTLRCLHM